MERGVALVGFMGAGKSTVGRALAERLGWPFVDLDEVLVEQAGPIPEQVARDGIEAFRARERAAALALCDGRRRVLATGGGTVVDPEVASAIGAAYRTVHLDLPFEVLAQRVGEGRGRPLWGPDARARLAERAPAYARAELALRIDGPPEVWVREIVERLGLDAAPSAPRGVRTTVGVRSASGGYDVHIAPSFSGLSEILREGACVLVTEETVGPLWAEAVRAEVGSAIVAEIVAAAGEVHKDRAAWSGLCDALIEAGVDRGTVVLALGGGVLGDLAGFAAATTLRGLPLVHLPTTLLAMVDSSVGGKVAVNHPRGKNLIGAFHPPIAVWMALGTLSTLPDAEIRCGWGEILKTALAVDGALFVDLERGLLRRALDDRDALAEVVARCVAAKASVVGQDEADRGARLALNAGHTVGHAIEAALGPGAIPHGEAVAIGLRAELRWAGILGVCRDPSLLDRLGRLADAAGLPGGTRRPQQLADLDGRRLFEAIGVDKKTLGDKIRVPLSTGVGETSIVELTHETLRETLPEALREILPNL